MKRGKHCYQKPLKDKRSQLKNMITYEYSFLIHPSMLNNPIMRVASVSESKLTTSDDTLLFYTRKYGGISLIICIRKNFPVLALVAS